MGHILNRWPMGTGQRRLHTSDRLKQVVRAYVERVRRAQAKKVTSYRGRRFYLL